jgi:ABC transporter DrrB family efflux protein
MTTTLTADPAAIRPLGPVESPPSFAVAASQTAVRTIRQFVRTPQLIGISLAQGSLFLLIFRYVFGGAIGTGHHYVDFLVPGFVMTTILFAGSGASTGVAEDVDSGMVERFRSLPLPRGSVLVGRALADTALLVLVLGVTSAVGLLVGFHYRTDAASALAAFGLAVAAGFAFEWLFVLLGLLAGNAQAAQGMSLLVFPLTFASSAYVPVHTMPGWLQAFAEHQPLTVLVDAARALCLGADPGQSTGRLVVEGLLWCFGLTVVFAPLAMARFHRR